MSVARVLTDGSFGPSASFNASGPYVRTGDVFSAHGNNIVQVPGSDVLYVTSGPVVISDAGGATLPNRVINVCALI